MILAALILVTATLRPATPTVGDVITIEFERPVVLDASPAYEVVSQDGRRVSIRSFQPRPFSISGTTGDVRFRNLVVPMKSVLKPDDDLRPAPLIPPRRSPLPRLPLVLLGGAVIGCVAALLLSRRRQAHQEPAVAPEERFRRAVEAAGRGPQRWAALADAVREYLPSIDPRLGRDLTTREILEVVARSHATFAVDTMRAILQAGDLEKFAPRGATSGASFETLASAALDLIPPVREEAAA